MDSTGSWARDAVIYQVYPRSFADSDGDGIGDLPGVTSRLDYLVELGVDAIWLSPFYRSPMADAGYDVSDYRDVDPLFGTLADFDALLTGAHQRGMKVMIDIVPNHTSDQHPWFQQALTGGPGGPGGPGSPARDRYIFRDGATGEDGTGEDGPGQDGPGQDGSGEPSNKPPNNWGSVFGGPAWTRVPDGSWYLHLFAPEQPDLNWEHPEVRAEFADILRFWLDRGVDGLRIDVADALVKPPGLPSDGPGAVMPDGTPVRYRDLDGVHDIYRQWRKILNEYTPERIAVAEAWVPGPQRLAHYVRPDELHQAFNFRFLSTPWSAAAYREVIDASLAAMAAVGAPTTWVLSNHDVVRHASRLGRPVEHTGGTAGGANRDEAPADPKLGLARARAATLLMLALPGSAYLYQGEELGLPEVFDLPDEVRQDPRFHRTGGEVRGRDGCRVPLPWSGSAPPFGFSPDGTPDSALWLPQPDDWAGLTVAAQRRDPESTWSMYREALRLRRELRLGLGKLRWLDSPNDDTLIVERSGTAGSTAGTMVCATNCGATPVALPRRYGDPVLSSGPVPDSGVLPPDTTVWWVG